MHIRVHLTDQYSWPWWVPGGHMGVGGVTRWVLGEITQWVLGGSHGGCWGRSHGG